MQETDITCILRLMRHGLASDEYELNAMRRYEEEE